jgi:hypothetical protein
MKKVIIAILAAVCIFCVGCGKAEGAADGGGSVAVKYFEPNAGPGTGHGVEIPAGDVEGRPYLLATYDAAGNLLSESFYDENGGKCFGPEEWNSMIHRYEYTYDDGRKTSATTLGLDGEPAASYLPPGKYREETAYDDGGDVECSRWIFLDGKIVERTSDDEGNLTEKVLFPNGDVRETKYDAEGKVVFDKLHKKEG